MTDQTTATAARLLRLLSALQTGREYPATELARRLGVTVRTIRRDVDRLRRLDYTVDSRPGAGGGYRLGFGMGIPPLLLDGEEAVAVALALRSATAGGVHGIEESAVQALIKLETSLPSMLRRRVQLLQTTVTPLHGPGPTVEVETLLVVAKAVGEHRQLHADYVTHLGEHQRLVLEPHHLVHARGIWYLLAWNPLRDAWRTYRLDRLTPRQSGRTFAPRADVPDAREHVSQAITTNVYPDRCRLTVHAPADVVGALVGPTRGRVSPIDASSCEVTGGSVSLREMALWVARLDHDVTVHEPPELRHQLDELAHKLLRSAHRAQNNDHDNEIDRPPPQRPSSPSTGQQ